MIPCNKQPNQFLAVINDWMNETRKVVDNLMGSPFDIWIFPIGPKVLNIPHPAPYHYCCIDIAGFGFLIKFHIYMISKIITCRLAQKNIGIGFNRQSIKH